MNTCHLNELMLQNRLKKIKSKVATMQTYVSCVSYIWTIICD